MTGRINLHNHQHNDNDDNGDEYIRTMQQCTVFIYLFMYN